MSEGGSPLNIGDLAKPFTKLIEVLANCSYILYEPTKTRKLADAEGDAARVEAKAEADATIIKSLAEADAALIKAVGDAEINLILGRGEIDAGQLALSAAERVRKIEERRQRNVNAIARNAFLALPDRVSEAKPDEDWVHQFFDSCQDIGDEGMQTIWGKLLAGEVAQPGTYSLLTLSVMKRLRKKEADLFTQFCSYLWTDGEVAFPILNKQVPIGDYELTSMAQSSFQHLDAYGLLHGTGSYLQQFTCQDNGRFRIRYFDRTFSFVSPQSRGQNSLDIGCAILTTVGAELVKISGARPDYNYMQFVIDDLQSRNCDFREEPSGEVLPK